MPKKLTQKEVIYQFTDMHKDRYDYSMVQYNGVDTKVKIICRIHGQFEQTPYLHKKGAGCGKCAGTARLTTAEVVKDFKKIYGGIYDFSKVNYKSAMIPVKILCPKHGEFEKKPNELKNGHGCPNCGNESSGKSSIIPIEEVLLTFNNVHGSKYDYTKIKYKNGTTPIKIICSKHGPFYQTPKAHKIGRGCGECGKLSSINNRKKKQKDIISQFNKVHNDKYDYSNFKYNGIFSKGLIKCPLHGLFSQIASLHLRGSNCPKCVGKHKHTTKEAINELRKVHGNKYRYPHFKYTFNSAKIKIICSIHGEFYQTFNCHQRGSGCPDCSINGYNPKKPGLLYYLRVGYGKAYKIGITNSTVEKRFRAIDLEHIKIIKMWYYHFGGEARSQEKKILKKFEKFKYSGEPILKSNGNTELFSYDILGLDNGL